MFVTSPKALEKLHFVVPAGSRAWRSTNIRTSAPVISAIEANPTDQATLEAVLGFIAADSVPAAAEREVCGRESARGQTTIVLQRIEQRVQV